MTSTRKISSVMLAPITLAVSLGWAIPAQAADDDWSLEVFGRLQLDAGDISPPDALPDPASGSEVRRARIGVKGDLPSGFGYKVELDFAGSDAEVTDAILTYKTGGLTLTGGQHNNFQSLEELTSSRFISFMERAAFTDAFGFQRRTGISAQYKSGDFLGQAGVFTQNVHELSDDWDDKISVDARAVYAPKKGDTQLHLGASLHWRDRGDGTETVRYRQRPHVHFTGTRYISTGKFAADSEMGLGLEAAAINGPFHVAGEAYWQTAQRPGMEDPTFFGGYAEVGYFLTGDDSRGYKSFKFNRVKPKNPVGGGGIGAIQINLRYDYLDLVDAGIVGGTQNGYAASLIWTPTDHTRLLLNYGHMSYDQAAIVAGTETSYGVDTIAMRAQFDF